MKTAILTNLRPRFQPRSRQGGAALLIAMLIVVLGLVTLLTFRTDRKGPEMEAQRKTALALAQAKEALLGRAATDGGNTANINPGRLVCPDDDNSGNSPGAACVNIPGRLPWKTLQIEDLRDGSAERLWLIVDPAFQPSSGPAAGANAIMNSSYISKVTLTLDGKPAIAIIVAPGRPLQGQNRINTGLVNSPSNLAANYLESYTNPIATQPVSSVYNDQILTISPQELFSIVTFRMARELSETAYDSAGAITGSTISDLTKPMIWSVNKWGDDVDPSSAIVGATIILKFQSCGIVYTITGPGSVVRSGPTC